MLRVRVLGPMEVALDGTVLTPPASRRAWDLLAWLAVHPGAHPRGTLAARFWPDVLDTSARASLRSAVWTLRRALGPTGATCLLATREHVGLANGDATDVDLHAFEAHVAAGRLSEAVALCERGELLHGIEDEWALRARDAHRERLLGVLEQLAVAAEVAGDSAAALDWTRRQAALDPFGEEAHRRLMTRLAATGERSAALATYRRLADRLARELALAPSAPTRALAQQLRAEAPIEAPLAPAHADATPPAPPPVDADAPSPPSTSMPSAAPAARRHLPLHGRAVELEGLLAAWEGARGGHGVAVAIRGDAGIGKTRLASELLERAMAAGARAAACAAPDLGGGAPFGMWAELARELARTLPAPPPAARWPDDLGQLVPDVVQRLGRTTSGARPHTPPELERARLFEAATELLAWAAHDRPLVVLMDDVHAADAPSLELLGYVGRRLATLPVLLLLTRRELPRRAELDALEHALRARGALAAELTLAPLPAAALGTLVRELGALSDADVTRAVDAAEGSPLLALATAQALRRGERGPPPSLRGAMRAALAPLAPNARHAAEAAAVAGRALARDELARLPLDDPAHAATQAIETGMLVGEDGRFGYRHALLRDAVYADLPDPRRATLHEQLADALDGDDAHAAERARHLRAAGRSEQAADALTRAAAHARSVAALAEATAFLREALALAPPTAERLLELADAEAWQSHRAPAEAAFAQALELIDPHDALALVRAHLRSARWYHGPICVPREVERAATSAQALLAALPDPPLRERCDALANRAWAQAVTGEIEVAEQLLAELHALVGRAPVDDDLTYDIAHARAQALIRRGRFEESYAPATAAGDASERNGRADLAYGCWMNAAGAATAASDFPRALAFLDRCDRQLRAAGLVGMVVPMLAARGFVLTRMGDLEGARAALAEQQALAERLGEPPLLSAAAYDRAMFALVEGEHAAAAQLFAVALAEQAPISRPLARLARAEALARCERCEEAEAELRATALEEVGPADFPDTLVPRMSRVQGLIAIARGDLPLAERRLRDAEEGWERRRERMQAGDGMNAVLADFGRPVLGLVEPGLELERVRADRAALAAMTATTSTATPQGA
jgi:DNA-binding SARP family transcriptional activator